MYKLEIRHKFDAGHKLTDSDLLVSKACARSHGHTYAVKVFLSTVELNKAGMVIDFKAVKNVIDELLDHRDINSIFESREDWRDEEPTAENIARFIFSNLQERLPKSIDIEEVHLCEGYRGEEFSSWAIITNNAL